MRALSEVFYSTAQAIGFHQFLEINGLLHKVIDICQRTLSAGRDFQMWHVPLETHDAHYIGEKIGCIWGQSLHDPHNMSSFLRGLFDMSDDVSVKVDFIEGRGVVIRIGNPDKEADARKEGSEEESTADRPNPSSDGVLQSSGV